MSRRPSHRPLHPSPVSPRWCTRVRGRPRDRHAPRAAAPRPAPRHAGPAAVPRPRTLPPPSPHGASHGRLAMSLQLDPAAMSLLPVVHTVPTASQSVKPQAQAACAGGEGRGAVPGLPTCGPWFITSSASAALTSTEAAGHSCSTRAALMPATGSAPAKQHQHHGSCNRPSGDGGGAC